MNLVVLREVLVSSRLLGDRDVRLDDRQLSVMMLSMIKEIEDTDLNICLDRVQNWVSKCDQLSSVKSPSIGMRFQTEAIPSSKLGLERA